MIRLSIAILFTIAAVMFGMSNSHDVELSFIFGSPSKIRLIFLLMVSFLLGIVVSSIWRMLSRIQLRAQLRRHRRVMARKSVDVDEPLPD